MACPNFSHSPFLRASSACSKSLRAIPRALAGTPKVSSDCGNGTGAAWASPGEGTLKASRIAYYRVGSMTTRFPYTTMTRRNYGMFISLRLKEERGLISPL